MQRRPLRPTDLDPLVDLFAAYDIVEHGETEMDLATIRGIVETEGTKSIVAEDSGRLVGLACVAANGEVESAVDPRMAGADQLHRELLGWILTQARERGLGHLEHWAGTSSDGAAVLLTESGFSHVRSVWKMRRELTGALPEPVWPAGAQLVPFDDPHAVWELIMRGFAGSFGSHHRPYEEWALTAVGEDRSAICVADGGELIAVATTSPHGGDGYIGQLTVEPGHRGRGLALALLHEAFRRDAAAGRPGTQLGVDGENDGARRLYDKAGMAVIGEYRRWERAV